MSRAPYDKPSTIQPVDGEVTVVGPGPAGVSITRKRRAKPHGVLVLPPIGPRAAMPAASILTTLKPRRSGPSASASRLRRCATRRSPWAATAKR